MPYTAAVDRYALFLALTLAFAPAQGTQVNATNRDGSSALMAAAFGGHLEAVQALIASGADVNVTDSQGRTPLMAAAMSGSLPLVRALLDRKADLRAEDRGGSTAL